MSRATQGQASGLPLLLRRSWGARPEDRCTFAVAVREEWSSALLHPARGDTSRRDALRPQHWPLTVEGWS